MEHHGHSTIDSYFLPESTWLKVRNGIFAVGALGWVATLLGWVLNPQQFYFSYLAAYFFFAIITVGALFWVEVQYLTGSVWSVTLRRLMENISVGAPWAAPLYIPILIGIPVLYEWSHADIVKHDEVLSGRGAFFSYPFFLTRVVLYFAIWTFFSFRIRKLSTEMDSTRSVKNILKAESLSAPGLLLVFLSGSFAAWDWIMSLEPRWYSTMFGVYCLAGGALAFMAMLTVISLALRDNGILENTIKLEHYHDLGKWMFAVTVFWTYIAFSQYMLIWYANLPEETIFFFHRFQGSWLWVSVFLIFGHFFFPFFLLLCRPAKRNLGILRFAAVWVLFVCYVDIYWLVMPVFHADSVHVHWLDFSSLLAVGSVFAFAFWQRMRRDSIVATGDIRFERSLAFHNQ